MLYLNSLQSSCRPRQKPHQQKEDFRGDTFWWRQCSTSPTSLALFWFSTAWACSYISCHESQTEILQSRSVNYLLTGSPWDPWTPLWHRFLDTVGDDVRFLYIYGGLSAEQNILSETKVYISRDRLYNNDSFLVCCVRVSLHRSHWSA